MAGARRRTQAISNNRDSCSGHSVFAEANLEEFLNSFFATEQKPLHTEESEGEAALAAASAFRALTSKGYFVGVDVNGMINVIPLKELEKKQL